MARGFRTGGAGGSYKKSVSVTSDGVKTRAQLLNELFTLIDTSKMTGRSYCEFVRAVAIQVFVAQRISSTYLWLSSSCTTNTGFDIEALNIKASGSTYTYYADGSFGHAESAVEAAGALTIRLTY